MTIYAGHIVEAATFLRDLVDEIGDLEQATGAQVAELQKAARTLKNGLSEAVVALDVEIGPEDTGGLSAAVSGAFAPDILPLVPAQLANLEQMDVLLDILGYAGRVLINAEQAG